MADRLSLGPILIFEPSVTEINNALTQITERIDALKGLRGRSEIHDRLGVSDPTQTADAVTLGISTSGIAGKVNKTGDTMTGALVLAGNAVQALEAVPKQQLDAQPGLDELRTVTRTELGADVVLVANTNTTILSQGLTMPASGGPWRVLAWWSMMFNVVGPGSGLQGWVDDQQGATSNIFADTQVATSNSNNGFNGAGISKQTYADSASITLLLRIRSNQADTVKATPFAGPTQIKTYLQTLVVKD